MQYLKELIIKNFKTNMRSYPVSLTIGRMISSFSLIVFPLFLYKYVFLGELSTSYIKNSNGLDYPTYIISGAFIYAIGVTTLMNVGRSTIMEIREGTYVTFIISPINKSLYFLGCMIEQLWRSLLEVFIILIFGVLIGVKVLDFFSLKMLLIILLNLLSFYGIALNLSNIMVTTRDTYITQNTLFISLLLLSGVTFPLEYLPTALQYLGKLIPITYGIELFRMGLIESSITVEMMEVMVKLCMLSITYIILGYIWFYKIKNNIIEKVLS